MLSVHFQRHYIDNIAHEQKNIIYILMQDKITLQVLLLSFTFQIIMEQNVCKILYFQTENTHTSKI